MTGNGRPLTHKTKVRILVAFTILAWATQTLLSQWSHGAEPADDAPSSPAAAAAAAAEQFVPAGARMAAGATLELRAEAHVFGGEVKLRQVCRWSTADAAVFLPVADLVVTRVKPGAPFRAITLADVKATLQGAGVNLAVVRFSGPMLCTITRADDAAEGRDSLGKWIDAREAKPAAAAGAPDEVLAAAALPATPASRPAAPAPLADVSPVRSLRQALSADLANRLALPEEALQLNFSAKDERALNLSEPQFKFDVRPQRVGGLGEVAWDVGIIAPGGTQRVSISARAQAWQDQVVVTRPLSAKQIIRAEDLAEKRTLVSRLTDEPLLTMSQAAGQQTGRDLKPGTVLTARMVDAVPLAKTGQTITVMVNRGGIRIKTAGRAMQGGSYGQSIQVKNEGTREIFDVILTGPQEGVIGEAGTKAEG